MLSHLHLHNVHIVLNRVLINVTRQLNSLFFPGAEFAGAHETGAPGDGEHGGAPADVKSFPDLIPANTAEVP